MFEFEALEFKTKMDKFMLLFFFVGICWGDENELVFAVQPIINCQIILNIILVIVGTA